MQEIITIFIIWRLALKIYEDCAVNNTDTLQKILLCELQTWSRDSLTLFTRGGEGRQNPSDLVTTFRNLLFDFTTKIVLGLIYLESVFNVPQTQVSKEKVAPQLQTKTVYLWGVQQCSVMLVRSRFYHFTYSNKRSLYSSRSGRNYRIRLAHEI